MFKYLLVIVSFSIMFFPRFLNWYYSITIDQPDQDYDFIIVGGGTTGSVLANRLSEKWKVLLLEAGDNDQPDFRISIPLLSTLIYETKSIWNYTAMTEHRSTTSNKKREIFLPRGKVLGGSSSINYNLFVRGSKHDYEMWETMGADGWGYQNVIKHFKNIEDSSPLMGASALRGHQGEIKVDYSYTTPMADIHFKAGKELELKSLDYNDEEMLGMHKFQVTVYGGKRQSAATSFLRTIARERQDRLHIIGKAHVKQVLFDQSDDEPPRANGIVYVKEGTEVKVGVKREVILSGGTIGTPHLLMLSGIGPKAHLEKMEIPVVTDLPGVGSNLQEHVAVIACIQANNLQPGKLFDDQLGLRALFNYLVYRKGPLGSPGAFDAVAFLRTKLAKDFRPDIQLIIMSAKWDDDSDVGVFLNKIFSIPPEFTAKKREFARKNNRNDVCDFLIAIIALHPHSKGEVKLRSRDYRDDPIINLNYLDKQEDVDVIIEGFRFLEEMEKTKSYQKIGARVTLFSTECDDHVIPRPRSCYEQFIREAAVGFHHPVGTNRMGGGNDAMTVVDPRLRQITKFDVEASFTFTYYKRGEGRIHNVTGIRIADASIMPTITSGNTMAPCYMIGDKCASAICEDYLTK